MILDWFCKKIRAPTYVKGRTCLKMLDIMLDLWYCHAIERSQIDMKKSMYILVFGTVLLTSCGNTEMSKAAIPAVTTETVSVTETELSTKATTTAMTTKAQETSVAATAVTIENVAEITLPLETKEQTQTVAEGTQSQGKKTQENKMAVQDHVPEIMESPVVTIMPVQTTIVPKSTMTTQTTTITATTIPEQSEEEKLIENDSNFSYDATDYDRALAVYEYMTANGCGTCVQYAYQTYEMCCEYGVECYFTWTENKLYGHVANVVKIDGMWFVLDTQAGCFLTENLCGFTEIVDENENFILDASIISETRYDQL